MSDFTRKVAHPDWLASATESLERSCRLSREDRIPEKIQAWMLVTPARRLLRVVYGSDLIAALALLRYAITNPWRLLIIRIRLRLGRTAVEMEKL